ncbi:MAG: hypothetical protein OXC62_01775 [Aestuariivita sp.]|nr:hypothetical protein [Aestuariivita sp.]
MGCANAVEQDTLIIGIDPVNVDRNDIGLFNAFQMLEQATHGDRGWVGRVHLDIR